MPIGWTAWGDAQTKEVAIRKAKQIKRDDPGTKVMITPIKDFQSKKADYYLISVKY